MDKIQYIKNLKEENKGAYCCNRFKLFYMQCFIAKIDIRYNKSRFYLFICNSYGINLNISNRNDRNW